MASPADPIVSCPACGINVKIEFINDHLDRQCASDSGGKTSVTETVDHPTPGKVGDCGHAVASCESLGLRSPSHEEKKRRTDGDVVLDNFGGLASCKSTTPLAHANSFLPLSEKVRPKDLCDFIGQDTVVGKDAVLSNLIEKDKIASSIFWGPPGSGKTSLAQIIAKATKGHFVAMSAVTSGVADVKKVAEDAKKNRSLTQRKTILFLDEIHRFNRAQQDILLPLIEKGIIILLGATTENPSFSLNAALLSRCRVFVLQKLQKEDLEVILDRALKSQMATLDGNPKLDIDADALAYIAAAADGDARVALNMLESVIMVSSTNKDIATQVTIQDVSAALLGKKTWLYDKSGEEHFNLISALHKSMRGNHANAALYWLMRMLMAGEDPLYISRRLVRFASEDIGLADSHALPLAVATYSACQMIGMPECEVNLAHCTTYLSHAPKSISVYEAMKLAKEFISSEPTYPVPLHLRNAPTSLMKDLEYGKGYKYTPHFANPKDADQEFLPYDMRHVNFFMDPPFTT